MRVATVNLLLACSEPSLRLQLLLEGTLLASLLTCEQELVFLSLRPAVLRGVRRADYHTLLLRASLAHLVVVDLLLSPSRAYLDAIINISRLDHNLVLRNRTLLHLVSHTDSHPLLRDLLLLFRWSGCSVILIRCFTFV